MRAQCQSSEAKGEMSPAAERVSSQMQEDAPGDTGSWEKEGHSHTSVSGSLTDDITVCDKRARFPACQGLHGFTRSRGKIQASTRLSGCIVFEAKSAVDKGRLLEKLRGCRICTSWLHNATRCHQLRSGVILCSTREERGKRCNKAHHTSLHMAQSAYCQTMSNQQRTVDDQVVSPRASINPGI